MNTDSLQTVIDSLQNILSTTSNSIEPYTTLIESQQSSYEMFIIILLTLLGVNIIVNFTFSRRRLKSEVENVFNEEESKFNTVIETKVQKSFNDYNKDSKVKIAAMEFDICRAFMRGHAEKNKYKECFNWAVRATHKSHLAGYKSSSNYFGKYSLEQLEKALKEFGLKNFIEGYNVDYPFESLLQEVDKFPDYLLVEKEKIKKMLNDTSNEDDKKDIKND